MENWRIAVGQEKGSEFEDWEMKGKALGGEWLAAASSTTKQQQQYFFQLITTLTSKFFSPRLPRSHHYFFFFFFKCKRNKTIAHVRNVSPVTQFLVLCSSSVYFVRSGVNLRARFVFTSELASSFPTFLFKFAFSRECTLSFNFFC